MVINYATNAIISRVKTKVINAIVKHNEYSRAIRTMR